MFEDYGQSIMHHRWTESTPLDDEKDTIEIAGLSVDQIRHV